jgi:hypothetical protein
VTSADIKRRQFFWGAAMAWGMFLLLFAPALFHILGSLEENKATGLGAVAGGLSEPFLFVGMAGVAATQVAAIIFLIRSFSTAHILRALFSVVSIVCSAFILLMAAVYAWLVYFYLARS